jgi:hypothetical protein
MSEQSHVSSAPIHPALHFEPEFAAIGIIGPSGPVFVIRHGEQAPSRENASGSKGQWTVNGRRVHPAPTQQGVLGDRWAPADVEAFCRDGAAPSFAVFMQSIRDELTRQIEFARPESASLVACWVAGTYFHPLFSTFARLNVTGPKRSGKSKLLQVIAAVSFNGLHLVIPTAATIFRLVEPLRPTLCLDEMEKLADKSDAHPIEALVNAGYKAGATVPRTEGDSKREVVLYNVYAPLALAGIAGLHDVMADRAITVEMQRGIAKARINAEVVPDDPVYSRIRAMGYRLALTGAPDVVKGLDVIRERQDTFTVLEGRPLELYRPLLALGVEASTSGDASFLRDLSVIVQEDASTREHLDADAARLFDALDGRFAGDLATVTFTPTELNTSAGGWLASPDKVGRLLHSYGFESKRTKKSTSYTVTRAKFLEQAKRWGYQTTLAGVGSDG